MLTFLRKLVLNLGPRAIAALGPMQYARYVIVFLSSLPAVFIGRTLKPIDRRMGAWPTRLRMFGRRVVIDCPATDRIVTDGTFTFGIVRELGIRNCYLRHGVERAMLDAGCVVDLGANRGVFSAIAAACGAKRVLAVETLPALAEAIRTNVAANGDVTPIIESVFVGTGGSYDTRKGDVATLAALLDRHAIDTVDVLKMDIEGSEYGLMEEPGWMDRVRSICMEVHPEHGRVGDVVDRLKAAGFSTVVADHKFRNVDDLQQAEFIWAVRGDGTLSGGR